MKMFLSSSAIASLVLSAIAFFPPTQASALSCMQAPPFAEAVAQAEIILEVMPLQLASTEEISFHWDVKVLKTYKGDVTVGARVQVIESVWPSTKDYQSALHEEEPMLLFLRASEMPDTFIYGLCDFTSRSLVEKPLTAEEKKILNAASTDDTCQPYVCKDGTTHARCAADGTVINYFAPVCLTHGGDAEASGFTDVSATHANADAIAYVKAEGIVSGYADGTYRPDQTINRAEFTKIITVALYGQAMIDQCGSFYPFSDVPRDAWYVKHVCRARDGWLLSGYPDNTFRPAQNINFVEAAKILANGYNLIHREEHCNGKLCPDVDTVDHPWYEQYVRALAAENAIPFSIVGLNQAITRGEMAEIIYRLKTKNTDKPSRTYNYLLGLMETSGEDDSVRRDDKRSSDVNSILSAIRFYALDHNGSLPSGIPLNESLEICSDTECDSSFVELQVLVGTYLPAIPQDPLITSQAETFYFISRDNAGYVTISAPHAESRVVSVTLSVGN